MRQSTYTRRNFMAAAPAPATPKLEFRRLGRTGLKVTSVGFGCMVTSDPSVVSKAVDLGINYFDTARVYQGGNNERMVGAALKSARNRLYISSKSVATTKEGALKDLDTSLAEIGTDHLDIWYLHNKSKPEQITDGLIEAQAIAKKQGKIRFAGVSVHMNQAAIIDAAVKKGAFDVILTSYNFAMDEGLNSSIESAAKAGVGIVAMKVMAGGTRFAAFYPTPDGLRQRMGREGATLAALKWVLKNKNVHTTIPGIVDQDQLDENIRAMAEPFRDADDRILQARLEQLRPLYCRMCGSCEGQCAKGLPVADVLRFLMYAEGYGQFALGRENFLSLSEEARQVRCSDCDNCTVTCPNGVKVARRLSRAQELFA